MRNAHFLALALLSLSGCTGSGTVATPAGVTPEAVAKYQAIANGVLSVAGAEAAIMGATPDTVAKVQTDATLVQAAINQLVPGMQAAAAAPVVATVKAAVDHLVATAATLPLPPAAKQTVLALQVLLPIAEASIIPPPGEVVVLPAAATTLPPAQAAAVLQTAKP